MPSGSWGSESCECDPSVHDPFTITREINDHADRETRVVVYVYGHIISIAVAHLMVMWRACAAKQASFTCVLFDTVSYQAVRAMGLTKYVDFRLCPQAERDIHWQPAPHQHCESCPFSTCSFSGTRPPQSGSTY